MGKDREAIVLAGGLGTRLRQTVPDLPKSMAPIGSRPFLSILLQLLSERGFTRVVLSLGFKANTIIDHFGTSFAGLHLVHKVEASPLGTGGAIRLALTDCEQDHVFVLNGDTYIDLNADAVERQWSASRRPIVVGCRVDDTSRYGRLIFDGKHLTGIAEKTSSGPGVINAGCYVLRKGQLDSFLPHQSFSFEKDYLAHALPNNDFDYYINDGKFIDIGIPEDYALSQRELAFPEKN